MLLLWAHISTVSPGSNSPISNKLDKEGETERGGPPFLGDANGQMAEILSIKVRWTQSKPL
jgi:hypothetical protein